jgi:hypothetical protein
MSWDYTLPGAGGLAPVAGYQSVLRSQPSTCHGRRRMEGQILCGDGIAIGRLGTSPKPIGQSDVANPRLTFSAPRCGVPT